MRGEEGEREGWERGGIGRGIERRERERGRGRRERGRHKLKTR